MVLADFDPHDAGEVERITAGRERNAPGMTVGAQIRSPQDSAPTPVNTRRQAKKYQPEKGLVFLIGGGVVAPYKPLKLSRLCGGRADDSGRGKSWISSLKTDHCPRLDCHEHFGEFISSTNPVERLNAEIKRRTEVVGIFPNEAAIVRLVGALLLEQNDEWQLQRRYLQLEGLQALGDNQPAKLSAVMR